MSIKINAQVTTAAALPSSWHHMMGTCMGEAPEGVELMLCCLSVRMSASQPCASAATESAVAGSSYCWMRLILEPSSVRLYISPF
jgi:hypothetical protein